MKKAQSEVITTVLIILLVLAAVFIVYTAVRGMVKTGTEKITDSSKCIGLDMVVTRNSLGTTATTTTPQVDATVTVQRNAGGDETEVKPIIQVGGTNTAAVCAEATLAPNENTVCTLTGRVLTSGQKITVSGMYGSTSCDITDEDGFIAV